MVAEGGLTEKEAAVYDRQLRVWGVETQKRLSSAKVLIVGCTGLGAEVAKNIVLAGVGSVTLVDDTPCAQRDPGNFLVLADADGSRTVAQACAAMLREMNPLVDVQAQAGPPAGSGLEREAHGLVLDLTGDPASVSASSVACRAAGLPFFAGGSRGTIGWAFADLGEHRTSYPSWARAMAADVGGRSLKRVHPVYLMLRAQALSPSGAGEGAGAAAADAIARLDEELGRPSSLQAEALESMTCTAHGLPAVSAVLGGILANDVLKAVSGRGRPMDNFFLYSIADGAGVVDRWGDA
ncbi:SUMO-activating enzyme subunit 1B-1 [Auxenochlorella protothecoides]|uniref:Ubiquitin-like 1-activating enzyme E1A n=1 Tax=Auxenochlorella protothecoides TaxID=3075 RepID=A0A087SRH6_AUXPR|nr:SUMO-activating enzyme subunit 1B-1 [Auxenochlorella protothecoides]KFM28330.1 SUMO-activating enzyme subunit 1B-1 [Auxenochlorella protothecoides]